MRKINVRQIIDDSKFNKFHTGMLISMMILLAYDGYDAVTLGVIGPTIIEQ